MKRYAIILIIFLKCNSSFGIIQDTTLDNKSIYREYYFFDKTSYDGLILALMEIEKGKNFKYLNGLLDSMLLSLKSKAINKIDHLNSDYYYINIQPICINESEAQLLRIKYRLMKKGKLKTKDKKYLCNRVFFWYASVIFEGNGADFSFIWLNSNFNNIILDYQNHNDSLHKSDLISTNKINSEYLNIGKDIFKLILDPNILNVLKSEDCNNFNKKHSIRGNNCSVKIEFQEILSYLLNNDITVFYTIKKV